MLREKLTEREDTTRKLAAQQQLIASSADTAADEVYRPTHQFTPFIDFLPRCPGRVII